jgi:hypothetical protein
MCQLAALVAIEPAVLVVLAGFALAAIVVVDFVLAIAVFVVELAAYPIQYHLLFCKPDYMHQQFSVAQFLL